MDRQLARWRAVGDQPQERAAHIIFVALLVRKKPLALVVEPEVLEKSQEARPEISAICHAHAFWGADFANIAANGRASNTTRRSAIFSPLT